jgi:hypothetical protein
MSFGHKQLQTLQYLDRLLCAKCLDKQKASDALYEAFHSLYFPSDLTPLAVDVFVNPLIAFMALLWLSKNGGYLPIFQMPPHLTILQSSMRLRGFHHLKGKLDSILKNATSGRAVKTVKSATLARTVKTVKTKKRIWDSDSEDTDEDTDMENIRLNKNSSRHHLALLEVGDGPKWFKYV